MGALDFWSRHLAACQAQGVSINAYAKREGLSAVSLYYWRKRLGLAGSRPRDVVASPFVPIQVERSDDCSGSCQLMLGDGFQANDQEPSLWLAEVLSELPYAQTADDYHRLLPWNIHPKDLAINPKP